MFVAISICLHDNLVSLWPVTVTQGRCSPPSAGTMPVASSPSAREASPPSLAHGLTMKTPSIATHRSAARQAVCLFICVSFQLPLQVFSTESSKSFHSSWTFFLLNRRSFQLTSYFELNKYKFLTHGMPFWLFSVSTFFHFVLHCFLFNRGRPSSLHRWATHYSLVCIWCFIPCYDFFLFPKLI